MQIEGEITFPEEPLPQRNEDAQPDETPIVEGEGSPQPEEESDN